MRPERYHHPPILQDARVIVAFLVVGLVSLVWYFAHAKYFLTNRQCAEFLCYFSILGLGLICGVWLLVTAHSRRESEWPHPYLAISPQRDARNCREAWSQDGVVLGHDVHRQPWVWPDRVRVMQGIVLGMTGMGKTTLLKNIITQDLHRVVGTPEDPHRIPMVIFDGKGDLEFFQDLLPHIHHAGRLKDLRVLNPARPDISVRYNPFHCTDEDYMSVVNMVFGSFNLHDEFFAIRGARRSLDIAMYSFTNVLLAAAVRESGRRGIHVRIYRDGEEYEREQAQARRHRSGTQALRGEANIRIRAKPPSRDYMHLKELCVDGRLLRMRSKQ